MSEASQAAVWFRERSLRRNRGVLRCFSSAVKCNTNEIASQAASPDSDLWSTALIFFYDGPCKWRVGPDLAGSIANCAKSRSESPRTHSDGVKAHDLLGIKKDAAWFQVHAFICMNKNVEPGQMQPHGGIDYCLWCFTRPADKDLSPGWVWTQYVLSHIRAVTAVTKELSYKRVG